MSASMTAILAHLAQRAIVNYCHTNACAMQFCRQQLKKKYSNSSYKTTGHTVLKLDMEHDLTPGSQKCKFGSSRVSKMAAFAKNYKNNKINFY